MTDISYNIWPQMSDNALMQQIGLFAKQNRLEQNKSQDELAYEAGISRSTLSLLEKGEAVTLPTLLQVLRVLGQLQVMDAFVVHKSVSPLALAKAEREKRQRARKRNPSGNKKIDW